MTSSPPPDPLSPQPPLPPPDPILQPSAPLPWGQPWDEPWRPHEPPEPPAPPPPVRKVPRDPVIITRPVPAPRSTPVDHTVPTRRTAPAATPTWSEPERRKSRSWIAIVVIAVPLAVCGARIVAGSWTTAQDDQMGVLDAPTARPSSSEVPAVPVVGPATIVDGGPASFDLPVGTGVRFSDRDGTWTVALMGVERVEECQDLLGNTVPVLVFDIYYEVLDGAVSIFPSNDFAFVLPDGTAARPGLTPMCAESPLEAFIIISVGDALRGSVPIPVPPGTDGTRGELSYGQLGPPTASWTVP